MRVSYEPLPPILSIREAVAQESFHGPAQTLSRGDVDAALSASEHRLGGELFIGGQPRS